MGLKHSDYFKKLQMYMMPKQGLTTLAGILGNVEHQAVKNYLIQRFIRTYDVNMLEAREEDPTQYRHFNDFFTRAIQLERRPISQADIVSPVDGCVSEIGHIQEGQILQAKGHQYTTAELLANDEKSHLFKQGAFATLYLSPKDYHRVHMPIDATLERMIYVPGKLFSVQPATTRTIPRLFARNERLAVFFDTAVGPMAMVLVGATIVGTIGTTWHGDIARSKTIASFHYSPRDNHALLHKRDEMGYFKLGSTVILLFANQHIAWHPSLQAGSSIRLGEALGAVAK